MLAISATGAGSRDHAQLKFIQMLCPVFTLTSQQPVALLVRRYCSLAAAVEGEFHDHSGILKQNSVQELQLVLL